MNNKETIRKIKEILKDANLNFANANDLKTFRVVGEEYLETLCQVYDINDIKLNNDAIISFQKVSSVLEKKLSVRSLANRELIWHYTMVLKAFMERIYTQAGRQYD